MILHPNGRQVHVMHSLRPQMHASMLLELEIQNERDMYPTRHVIHELRASHNVEVTGVDILVLVCHGVSLHFG